MRKKPYPVTDLTGGLNVSRDSLFLLDKESPNMINTRISKGMLRKDVGATLFSNDLPLDGTIMYIDTFFLQDGSSHLLIVTTKWVYKYDVNNDIFNIINPTDFDTGAISLYFLEASQTIARTGTWSLVGNSFSHVSGTEAGSAYLSGTDIAFVNGNFLRTYRWTDPNWAQVGNALNIAGMIRPQLTELTSTDVAYLDSSLEELRCYRWTSPDWAQVGSSLSIPGISYVSLATLTTDTIAFIDRGLKELRCYYFDGSTWVQIGNSLNFYEASYPRITGLTSSRIALIDSSDHTLRCFEFDGMDWQQVGNAFYTSPTDNTYYAHRGDIEALNSTDVAVHNWEYLYCYSFNGSDWTLIPDAFNIANDSYSTITKMSEDSVAVWGMNLDILRYYTFTTESFITDGFVVDDAIDTDAILQTKSYIITHVTRKVMTVLRGLVDEGPVTKTIYRLTPLTGDEDYPFSSVMTLSSIGADLYFLTNLKDKLMMWTGSGRFTVKNVYAKRLAVFKSRLFLGFIISGGTASPSRVQWSVVGDPEDLTGVGSGFVELVDTLDWITALIPFKDKLFICKERSIWELIYVGGYSICVPALKLDGVGTTAPNSAMSLGEDIIFFGNDNIYTYNGLSLNSIADQLFTILYDTKERVVNGPRLARCASLYVEELEEYWLILPTIGTSTSLLLKYNFMYKSWSIKNNEVTSLGYYSAVPHTLWIDLTGTWDVQDWIWMEKILPAGAPTTLLGQADGNLYEDNRVTLSDAYMSFETKDWMFTHAHRWVEFKIIAKGGTFLLSYSTNSGVSWSPAKSCGAEDYFETYTIYLNVTSEKIRCKIESYDEDLTIKWIEPWYIPRTREKDSITAM